LTPGNTGILQNIAFESTRLFAVRQNQHQTWLRLAKSALHKVAIRWDFAFRRKKQNKNLSEQEANKGRTFCRGNLWRMAGKCAPKPMSASILHIRLSNIIPRIWLRSERSLISWD